MASTLHRACRKKDLHESRPVAHVRAVCGRRTRARVAGDGRGRPPCASGPSASPAAAPGGQAAHRGGPGAGGAAGRCDDLRRGLVLVNGPSRRATGPASTVRTGAAATSAAPVRLSWLPAPRRRCYPVHDARSRSRWRAVRYRVLCVGGREDIMGLLDGKTAVIYGVANHRSIAWGIAQAMQREGARLALTYQGERVERYVRDLATSLTDPLVLPCDVTDDGQIDEVYRQIGATFGRLDAVVHSVAFAERDDLEGRFVDTSRRGL